MTEKEKIFNDIVKDYDKSEHFSGKLCPDQYICNIEIIKNYYFNQNTRKNISRTKRIFCGISFDNWMIVDSLYSFFFKAT